MAIEDLRERIPVQQSGGVSLQESADPLELESRNKEAFPSKRGILQFHEMRRHPLETISIEIRIRLSIRILSNPLFLIRLDM